MKKRLMKIVRSLSLQDLDWIAGSLVLLCLGVLAISTIGTPSPYDGTLADINRPPTNPVARVLLDRRPASVAIPESGRVGGEDDRYGPDQSAATTEVAGNRSLPFGTDGRGRDIWLGIRLGARTVLVPGFFAALIGVLLGAFLGVTEELAERPWLPPICQSVRTILGSFPKFLILLVVLGAGLGQAGGMLVFALAVGILGSARVAEVVRAQVLVLRQSDFIEACREMGLTQQQIAVRHILNGVSRGLLLGLFVSGIAEAILLEAMMAAIGWQLAGFSQATWANMVAEEFSKVQNLMLWSSVPPAIAIVILIAGLHLLGNGLSRRCHLARLES